MSAETPYYRYPEAIVETDWLAANLDDPTLRIFDCTTHLVYTPEGSLDPYTVKSGREDYEAGHIPGAISLPFPMIEQDHKSYLRNAGTIVVYDTDWDDVIAVSASKRLMELSYKEVFTLRGGLEAWVADGNPVEKGPPSEATEEQAGRR